MQMGKHKRLIVSGVILSIAFICAIFIFIGFSRTHKVIYTGYPSASQVIKPNAQPKSLKDFSSLQDEVAAKKWKEASDEATAYGNDIKNGRNLRISAYAYCIYAATRNNNLSTAADCQQKGTAIIAQLTDKAERETATKIFEATAKNEPLESNISLGQSTQHE